MSFLSFCASMRKGYDILDEERRWEIKVEHTIATIFDSAKNKDWLLLSYVWYDMR